MDHKHHHHDHGGQDMDWTAMVRKLELEAEVFSPLLAEASQSLVEVCERREVDVRRVIDLGSGPGVGSGVLAETFPSATVLAVDGAAEMLEHVAARAERLGLAPRVQTRVVDLPAGLTDLGPADVVWASMVLHHLGDEATTFGAIRSLLEPGGLFALVEFGEPTRVVPDEVDLGRPGLWERLDTAWGAWVVDLRADQAAAIASADHRSLLEQAGFDVVVDRIVTAHLDAPLDDRAREVALGSLKGLRERVEPYADADDLAALDTLADEHDPDGFLHREEVFLRASRHLYVATPAP